MKRLIMLCVCLLPIAAGTGGLGTVLEVPDTVVVLTDNRPEEGKKRYRESVTSPLVILGDEGFDVNPKKYLKYELSVRKPANEPMLTLVIDAFTVADYFPKRLINSQNIALTGAFAGQGGFYYGATAAPEVIDSIICTLEGTLNGKPVRVRSQKPYVISKYAFSVKAQPEWNEAVRQSIAGCAALAVESSQKQ